MHQPALAQKDKVYTGERSDTSKSKKNEKEKNDEWKERTTWGGNAQLWIGNSTFILLSPTIGYLPIKNVNVGLGIIYNYTSYRSPYGEYSQSIFGGHSYARYIIAESYFVQAQYDRLYQPDFLSINPKAKTWVDYFLVGGGFMQNIGERTALMSSIMFYVNPEPLSIYQNRFIIQFGLMSTF
ncbi:MAG: hypothetical protein JNL60_02250 [Bacteroidia bacterium]|nr:hypothetical protein [Bacteroidia bacterium]